MESSTDQSIFSWSPGRLRPSFSNFLGFLAVHPVEFKDSAAVVPIQSKSVAYTVTNTGLEIELPVVKDARNLSWGLLACHFKDDFSGCLSIPLQNFGQNLYRRACGRTTTSHLLSQRTERVCILRGVTTEPEFVYGNVFLFLKSFPYSFELCNAIPGNQWNRRASVMKFPGGKESYEATWLFNTCIINGKELLMVSVEVIRITHSLYVDEIDLWNKRKVETHQTRHGGGGVRSFSSIMS